MFLDRLSVCLAITAALYLGGVGRADLPCTYEFANPDSVCANAVDTESPDTACSKYDDQKAKCLAIASNPYYVNTTTIPDLPEGEKLKHGWQCKGSKDAASFCKVVTNEKGETQNRLCGTAYKCKWNIDTSTCYKDAYEPWNVYSKYHKTGPCSEDLPGEGRPAGRK